MGSPTRPAAAAPPPLAHHRFWPPRLPHRIVPPATSLWHNLAVSALRHPDHPALVFFDRVTRYAELAQQAERLAAHLHHAGVTRGDRVLLMMQNGPALVVAHFAILRANAVVVPVNPMNRAEELRHAITDSGARAAITTSDLAAELARASSAVSPHQALRHLVVAHWADALDASGEAAAPTAWRDWLGTRHPLPPLVGGTVTAWVDALATDAPAPPVLVGPDDLALLPYTSGTTGLPKGCMHPHRTVMHNAVAASGWVHSGPHSTVLAVIPMFHITGMVSGLHAAVYAAATLVLMPRWDRELAGRWLSRWRVTHWTNIPTMVIDLLASPQAASFDLSSVQYIGGGGAAMPRAVAERLLSQYGLHYNEGYGLTETAAPTHSNPPHAPKPQCLGIPFVGVEAHVVDPETLQPLPPHAQGEIVVRGPQVFNGYWQRPDATAEAFVQINGQRFFRTGDLGHVDDDGYYFLTDRLKRMINASGFKVWPAEVEALLFRHPGVQEACVIATPDAYRGQSVKAVVVRRPGHAELTEQGLMDWCRTEMSAYKVPRKVSFVDALPKSGSGKVMWRALQEQEVAGTTTRPPDASE